MLNLITRSAMVASLSLALSHVAMAAVQPVTWVSKRPVSIAHWVVKNTSTPVYFVPRHDVAMLDVSLIFQAGSAQDGKQWGLANLTGSLIGTGTHRHNEQQMAERFSRAGAELNTDVSRDTMVIHYRTMTNPKYYRDAITDWQEAVTQLRVDAAVTHRIKNQIQVALKAEKDRPTAMGSHALFRALYGKHPYAHPIKGTAKTLAGLTPDDVLSFYKKHAVQKQLAVVIVGDLSLSKAHRLARRLVTALPGGEASTPLPISLAPVSPKQIFVSMPKSQDSVFIAQLGFLPYDAHYYARVVGNHAFGGASLTSMLFKEVREKRGLAYYAGSQMALLAAGGPFVMVTQSRLSAAASASRVMHKTFAQFIEHGLPPAILKETKHSLIGQFPLMYASNASIMSRLVAMVRYHYPMSFFADYPKKIHAVTNALVRQAFAPLEPQQWVEVVAGGRNTFIRPKSKKHKRA